MEAFLAIAVLLFFLAMPIAWIFGRIEEAMTREKRIRQDEALLAELKARDKLQEEKHKQLCIERREQARRSFAERMAKQGKMSYEEAYRQYT